MKYLHSLQPPVIHSDLKSKNILISDKFVVKVSKLLPLRAGFRRGPGGGMAPGPPPVGAPTKIIFFVVGSFCLKINRLKPSINCKQ